MGSQPRVLHVVISLDCGGLERLVVDWTNARNTKYPGSTTVCCLDKLGDLVKQVEGNAVICLNANRAKFPWDAAAVRQLYSDNADDIDVIHSHNLAPQQYAYLASRKSGVKHVHTQHGANVHNMGIKNRLRSKFLCARTDKIVAVSESVRASMIEKQGISGEKIDVIRNGVGIEPRMPAKPEAWDANACQARGMGREYARAELGIAEDHFVLGYVGRLEGVKGCDRLINAFSKMASRRACQAEGVGKEDTESQSSNASAVESAVAQRAKEEAQRAKEDHPIDQSHQKQMKLLLVGDGAERKSLEKQAGKLGVGDRVVFAGFQEDVSKYYAAMDLFVMPSRSEGLPIALLEAMAAGVPVAVTDVGECREVIEDGKAGVLLPEDENRWVDKIADLMIEIRGQGAEVRKIVKAAQARVKENYSMDKTLEKYERLYRDV